MAAYLGYTADEDAVSWQTNYYFFKPSKTRVGKKLKMFRKNGEDNVPSGRPTQNC